MILLEKSALDTYSIRYGDYSFNNLIILATALYQSKEELDTKIAKIKGLQQFLKNSFRKHLSDDTQLLCSSYKYAFGETQVEDCGICGDCTDIIALFNDLDTRISSLSEEELKGLFPNSIPKLR